MRVLEPGVTEKRVECSNCKAKLSYVYKDIDKFYDDILNKTFYYVVCPLCETRIFVEREEY